MIKKSKIKVVVIRDVNFHVPDGPHTFSHENAKRRNKGHEKNYLARMKAQRSQYGKAKAPPPPEPVVLISAGGVEIPRFATREQRKDILKRDSYRCRYCGCSVTMVSANMDHMKPYKYGGPTTTANLVAACQDCNKAKGNQKWRPSASIRSRKDRRRSA